MNKELKKSMDKIEKRIEKQNAEKYITFSMMYRDILTKTVTEYKRSNKTQELQK